MPPIELTIIIISYNTRALLKQTLDSIQIQENWETIVVDNGSADGSVQLIKQHYPAVHLIENGKNLGFAAANNQAIKIAKGKYIILLNSDTQIRDDALARMIDYLNKNNSVGMVTPKIVLPDGAIDLACHRGEPTPWRAFTYFTKLEQIFPNNQIFGGYHQTHLNFEQVHEIEATAGTALMVRKTAIDQVGLLDEQFFFYAEDLDWCKRFREAGWKIVYLPSAIILHHKSASGKKHKSDKQKAQQAKQYFWNTMKQYYEKHYGNKYPLWFKKLIYLTIDIKKRISM